MMKIGVLWSVFVWGILIGCGSGGCFEIRGKVEGWDGEQVYLVSRNNEGSWDTLSCAQVDNESFVLKGRVEQPLIALIKGSYKFKPLPVFMENTNFEVKIDSRYPDSSRIEGGTLQSLNNDYIRRRSIITEEMQMLKDSFRSIRKTGEQEIIERIIQKYNQLDSLRSENEVFFLRTYGESLPAVYTLFRKNGRIPFERFHFLYSLLSDKMKNTPYGKIVSERYRKAKITAVGEVAPNFEAATPSGKPLSLYSVKAKVKIVDFWASWCAPCREENSHVVALYDKYRDKGLEIVSISLDVKEEAWLKAIKDDGLKWKHVSDLKGWDCTVAQLYDIHEVPSIFVLDENNVIVGSYLRGEQLDECVRNMLERGK